MLGFFFFMVPYISWKDTLHSAMSFFSDRLHTTFSVCLSEWCSGFAEFRESEETKPKISSNNTGVASWNSYWILSDDFIIQSCDVLSRKVRITESWLRPLLARIVFLKPFSEWWQEAQAGHDWREFHRQDKRPSCLLGDIFVRQQTSAFSVFTNIFYILKGICGECVSTCACVCWHGNVLNVKFLKRMIPG